MVLTWGHLHKSENKGFDSTPLFLPSALGAGAGGSQLCRAADFHILHGRGSHPPVQNNLGCTSGYFYLHILYWVCCMCTRWPDSSALLLPHDLQRGNRTVRFKTAFLGHLVITSDILVSILSVFLATLKIERRESTSNL